MTLEPRTRAAAAATVVGLVLGLPTMARDIGFIDRGELAAVATTLGIAHPTGYPVLTLLGRVATLAPLPPWLALNLLAVAMVAAGLGVMVAFFDAALARAAPEIPPGRRAAAALAGALGVGVTETWWRQANGFEAYALHALMLPLVAWAFVRWLDALEARPKSIAWLSASRFGYTVGIGLANHLTLGLLAPACIFTTIVVSGIRLITIARMLAAAPAFLLALSAYFYLPVRAATEPRFAWGDPREMWRLVSHVTGRQYRGWFFSSWDVAKEQLGFFFARLPHEFVGAGLAVVLFGAWRLGRAERRDVGLWAVVLFATGVVGFGSYAIRDIDPYGMPALMAIGLALAAGWVALAERLGARVAVALAAASLVVGVAIHYRGADESGNHLPADLARNRLDELPRNAVLISSQWDYTVSATWYLQEVEHRRPDVLVVNPELMRRTWYLTELARRAPKFASGFAGEVGTFRTEVEPFERGAPYPAARIEAAYRSMLGAMVRSALPERRVFVTSELIREPWSSWRRVPIGLAFELRRDSIYVEAAEPHYRYRPWLGHVDAYVATTASIYAEAMIARMAYETEWSRGDRARVFGETALAFDPGFQRDRIPPLPFDGRQLVLQSIDFFDRIREFLNRPQ